jgi:hypothetical protein
MAEPTRRRLRTAVDEFGAIGGCATLGALAATRGLAAVGGVVALCSPAA